MSIYLCSRRIRAVVASLVLLSGLMPLLGCGSPGVAYQRLIWEGPLEVGLQEFGGEPVAYDHPAFLLQGEVALRLGEVRVETEEGDGERLFDEGEADDLARAFCITLGRARSIERVRFSLDRKVEGPGGGAWLTSRGVAFVRPAGVLNVVFESLTRELDFDEELDWGEATSAPHDGPFLVSSGEATPASASPHGRWFTARVQAQANPLVTVRSGASPGTAATTSSWTTKELDACLRLLDDLLEEGHIAPEVHAQKREALLRVRAMLR